jgi:hypothetical protein
MSRNLVSIRIFVGLTVTTMVACMPPVAPGPCSPAESSASPAGETAKNDAPANSGGSCESGHAADCTAEGDALWSSDNDADFARAGAFYQKACDWHDGDGCARLYELAKLDMPRDEKKLAAIAIRGCEAKSAQCCASVGDHYEEGKGLERDHPRAIAARAVACEGSIWVDCNTIKTLAKKPGEKAAKEVFDQWTASCTKGDQKACEIVKR